MFEFIRKNKAVAIVGGLALTAIVTAPVMAQRDPAYAAARASGVIGEKPDGFLGYVTSPSASVKAMVEDLNIKRKAAYTRKAQETNSTVEQFAFTSGCNLIMRTTAGEKYQAPDGSWQTRTEAAPIRDSRCP
ncbi:YdbL family protein [Parasphingorhabdus sp. JC815]|uniref:YdbL family protein n=1 Tax=Parasphingorhabdus sp. JC815 TaxID=3232140 RepID=UPI003459A3B7